MPGSLSGLSDGWSTIRERCIGPGESDDLVAESGDKAAGRECSHATVALPDLQLRAPAWRVPGTRGADDRRVGAEAVAAALERVERG